MYELEIIKKMYPDQCPVCKKNWNMEPFKNCFTKTYTENLMQVVFKCPSKSCWTLFISLFSHLFPLPEWQYVESALIQSTKEIYFSKEIKSVSENFCNIYREAAIAEENNLRQIAGMGYRKALEFLMKDYLILKNPNDSEKIKNLMIWNSSFLAYIDHKRLKSAFQKATRLWNDETHYTRKWIDQDVNDLKNLINICQSFITQDLQLDYYEEAMI